MLREDCVGCVNVHLCRMLAESDCPKCPELLMCPPEQFGQGYKKCRVPIEMFGKLSKRCQLQEKFAIYLAPEDTDTPEVDKTPKDTRVLPPRIICLRCGGSGIATIFYEMQSTDSALGIFGDSSLTPREEMCCRKCGLRDVVAKKLREFTEKSSVFTL